jgi:hypothetical protein
LDNAAIAYGIIWGNGFDQDSVWRLQIKPYIYIDIIHTNNGVILSENISIEIDQEQYLGRNIQWRAPERAKK